MYTTDIHDQLIVYEHPSVIVGRVRNIRIRRNVVSEPPMKFTSEIIIVHGGMLIQRKKIVASKSPRSIGLLICQQIDRFFLGNFWNVLEPHVKILFGRHRRIRIQGGQIIPRRFFGRPIQLL